MARDLRNTGEAHEAMTASRIVPLRRMAPAKVKPAKPVARPLFIPERTPLLPQSWQGWAICGALLVFDVAPFVFLAWRFL
jgi:hypothetical protein